MTPVVRRAAVVVAASGLVALQHGVPVAYLSRGRWHHYLLHQMVGWGAGLAGPRWWAS